MFDPSQLHVVTARSNPLGWKKPHANWEAFARHMLAAGVSLTVVECAYGAEDFACEAPPMDDASHAARFLHVGVRAKTRVWNKECLLNLGIQRRPEAQYIAWFDADVIFRRPDWAQTTLRALQHYDVVQPWRTCYDLGPNGEHIAAHTSFCHQLFIGQPLVPDNWTSPYWQGAGGKNVYPHCLPGDSLVVPGGKVTAAAVRPFEGELVVIRTARGHDLSCSPNHPILSDGQWVRADSLKVGDNVLRHVRGNGMIGKPDEKHVPARIEDVARAFGERAGAHRFACSLPDNLDNRRSNSKVAQVWTDGDLTTECDPSSVKRSSDLAFARIVKLAAGGGDRVGTHDLFGQAFGFAFTANEATRTSASPPMFGRRPFVHASADSRADFIAAPVINSVPGRFASGSGDRTGCLNQAVRSPLLGADALGNHFTRVVDVHADDAGALRRTLAGQVERDEVVYVGRREFSGHLYDLQTEHGYILADGLVTHNSGYAWAATRQALDWCGGLFELGGMGSGDHHVALGLAGRAHDSLPPGPHTAYCQEVIRWGQRAARHVNGNIGFVEGTIEHLFHGRKQDRSYLSRWDMFIKHGFDPLDDLKRNTFGVLEFACNKPLLRRDFDRYLMSRNEDINSL